MSTPAANAITSSVPLLSPELVTIFYMALNFFTSVGIININKVLFQTYKFQFSTLLTGFHFVVTFLGLLVCNMFGMFEIKIVPIRQVIPLCFAFVGFVVFNNLSLQFNSIGFYQLMKVLTTPTIVVIQYLYFSVNVHDKLKLALLPVCVGVAMATVSDIEVNFWGTFHAVCGIFSTSFYQIWVKSKQQDLQLNAYQLLFLQAPLSAVMVFLLSFAFENSYGPHGWLEYDYSIPSITTIVLSCLVAFLVNLSIFLVIGKTSPVAYNVLGHFKLCVILLSGFIFFGEDANTIKIIGTLLTLAGVITYTHLQQTLSSGWEKREATAGAAAAPSTNGTTASEKTLIPEERERLIPLPSKEETNGVKEDATDDSADHKA